MAHCRAQSLAAYMAVVLRSGGGEGRREVQDREPGGDVLVGSSSAEEPVQTEALRRIDSLGNRSVLLDAPSGDALLQPTDE
jgi:hypothetical protein